MPVTVVTETLRGYETREAPRTEQEAAAQAERELLARLEESLEEGTILSRELTTEIMGDTLLVTLTAECEEQIGKFVEIPKE